MQVERTVEPVLFVEHFILLLMCDAVLTLLLFWLLLLNWCYLWAPYFWCFGTWDMGVAGSLAITQLFNLTMMSVLSYWSLWSRLCKQQVCWCCLSCSQSSGRRFSLLFSSIPILRLVSLKCGKVFELHVLVGNRNCILNEECRTTHRRVFLVSVELEKLSML